MSKAIVYASYHSQEYRDTETQGFGGTSGDDLAQPHAKAGSLEQVTQESVQVGSEYLQRRKLHSPSRQPAPVLCHSSREDDLSHVQVEPPVFLFVPTATGSVAEHHQKQPGSTHLPPTL